MLLARPLTVHLFRIAGIALEEWMYRQKKCTGNFLFRTNRLDIYTHQAIELIEIHYIIRCNEP